MVDNSVQCPVCTLYLHAGMNLSDHLETHPKEQVIKALVQMTIVGGGSGNSSGTSALAAAMLAGGGSGGGGGGVGGASGDSSADDDKSAITGSCVEVKPVVAPKSISAAAPAAQPSPPPLSTALATPSSISSSSSTSSAATANSSSSSNSNSKQNNPPMKALKCEPLPTEARANTSAHPTTPTSTSTGTTSSSSSSGINGGLYQPSLVTPDYRFNQQQQQQQQHTSYGRGGNAPTATLVIPQVPNQHFLASHPQQAHFSHQQQQQQQQQQHQNAQQSQQQAQTQQQQQQQPSLKYTYDSAFPPPLQLFMLQQQQPAAASAQTNSPPHQKPPPAYGAAISQIRSQHNQNKSQQHTQQHQQQQQPQQLQQSHVNVHHNHNLSLAPPTASVAAAAASSAGPPAGKQLAANKAHTEVFLNPPPPPPHAQTQLQSLGQHGSANSSAATSSSSARLLHQQHQHHQQQQQQPQPVSLQAYASSGAGVSSSSSCSSSSSSAAAAAPATSGIRVHRQTNSPFGALLNAAAAVACPSPASSTTSSSVLRFAESPVAHYLERENGDFIVQETPKHIVECVEKEDGEFSVIERIYQSPPSVLHIHDDDEDDDDDEEDEEAEEEAPVEDEDGDDEREENSRSRSTKTTKKSRKTKSKRTSKRHSDEEDFMSLSSGCESELERKQDHPSTSLTAAQPPALCTAPSTSRAAATAATCSNLADNHSSSASNSISGSSGSSITPSTATGNGNGSSTATKSKKNRITVLSDVPLNMNEYLDLMGNIVASSRIGAARPFAAVAPIPLVKVEKEEPLDEYDSEAAQQQLEQKPSLEHATTSVIRMASASATASAVSVEDLSQPPPMKVEVEPNTKLLPQRFTTPAQQLVRGPKKLVIKPKATATVTATKKTDKHPTTSTSSSSSSSSSGSNNPTISRELVQVKSETLEVTTTPSGTSILEKHLTTSTSSSRKLQQHSAVNDDDARVLLEFANSKQPQTLEAASTTFVVNASVGFPSAGSVFASTSKAAAASVVAVSKPEDEYILPDNNLDVDEIVISSSSSYASSAAHQVSVAGALQPPDFNFLYHQQTSTTATATTGAYFHPFSKQQHQHQQQQSHLQQHTHGVSDATNAATLASSSSNSLDHDSMNASFRVAKTQALQSWYQHQHQDQEPGVTGGGASGGNQSHEVSHHHHQPTNFNAALAAVDCCSVALDGDAKYLDLDACKREQLSSSNLPSASASTSTTSSSFAGAGTESSLVGGLNIRTDEKMPAKGEISEQESNCDIENSWSESVYGDISQRYFRNQFSGGYNPDWRQDYYPAQDLSGQQREQKRFDFHSLDDEASSSSRKSQLLDTAPMTAISSTCTSTSSALLAGPPIASTSRAAAEAAAEAAAMAIATQRKQQRRKLYKCPHCEAIFEKLKERNAHMIGEHNYVRQNRRLICTQPQQVAGTAMLPPQQQQQQLQQQQQSMLLQSSEGGELHEDSKDGIVKIKQEQCQEKTEVEAPMHSHSELLSDVKDSELLGIGEADGVDNGQGDIKPPSQLDEKPTLPPLAMTTPAAKLAALYRMLIAYNESKLGQERNNLSELEQKAMEKSIFLCYVCRTDFPSVKLYDAHLTEHPAECFTCGKKFCRWKNFSLHLKRHLGWKEFGCYVCDKKFVVRSALVEHMRMHTGQTPLKCKICGKKFKRYSNLTQHRKRHTKMILRKKEYVCHCGEVLPSKARFLWHKETHDLKPKCCPYCCDRFVHANSLRRHIRLAHSEKFDYSEPIECPMCKQTFAKTSIKAHMATHSTDPQYDCTICNKSFSTKWNLKIHSWVHANRTAKPFKCEYCPKAFVRELDFKNHINAHKQIKPYTCEYCGCKFIRKYNYMRHRREHHGTKKFTCDQCDKTFHRHYYLVEHRRMHTGERPFTCTICGKSSTTKTNHNKHLKIHHSRDPFTVEV